MPLKIQNILLRNTHLEKPARAHSRTDHPARDAACTSSSCLSNMAFTGDGWVAEASSCCKRIIGGCGPSGDMSPRSGDVAAPSSGFKNKTHDMVFSTVGLSCITDNALSVLNRMRSLSSPPSARQLTPSRLSYRRDERPPEKLYLPAARPPSFITHLSLWSQPEPPPRAFAPSLSWCAAIAQTPPLGTAPLGTDTPLCISSPGSPC